jgi:hypothetical protein
MSRSARPEYTVSFSAEGADIGWRSVARRHADARKPIRIVMRGLN